jgi:hypothetical protein
MDAKTLSLQLPKLHALNERLKKLERVLLDEAIKLDKALKARVDDKDDCLDDYEIELQLSFYLLESDERFIENEDNILASIDEYLKGVSLDVTKTRQRWGSNHNEFRRREGHPMQGEEHCWWFHSLYDHKDMSFEDMLRIGMIWSDIKVAYQYRDEHN